MSFDFTEYLVTESGKIISKETARERLLYTYEPYSPYYNENTIVGEVVEDDRSTNGTGRELRSSESSDIP